MNLRYKNPSYKSANLRAILATLFLAAFGIITVASMFSTIADIDLLRQVENGKMSESEYLSKQTRQEIIAYLSIASLIAAAIAFLTWIRLAHHNLEPIGVRNYRFSPGWAVGAWFVPILSLYRPYQIMEEIWKGSYPRITALDAWENSDVSILLGLWWITWLISTWIGNLAFNLIFRIQTIDDLIRNATMNMVFDGVSIASMLMLLILIWQITTNQQKKHVACQTLPQTLPKTESTVNDTDTVTEPTTQPPITQPPTKAQCPRCRKEVFSKDLRLGVCNQCRSRLF